MIPFEICIDFLEKCKFFVYNKSPLFLFNTIYLDWPQVANLISKFTYNKNAKTIITFSLKINNSLKLLDLNKKDKLNYFAYVV